MSSNNEALLPWTIGKEHLVKYRDSCSDNLEKEGVKFLQLHRQLLHNSKIKVPLFYIQPFEEGKTHLFWFINKNKA